MGYVGVYLLIGGVDHTGAHLYEVHAHGSTVTRPYASDGLVSSFFLSFHSSSAMFILSSDSPNNNNNISGSGSYAAGTVLERDWKPNMTVSGFDKFHLIEVLAFSFEKCFSLKSWEPY